MIRSSMQLPSWRSLPVPGVTAFQAQSGRICVPLWIQEWLPDGPDTAVGLALAPVQAPEPQWNEALVMWVCEFHLHTGSESGVGQSSQFFSNLLPLPFLALPVSRGFTSCIAQSHASGIQVPPIHTNSVQVFVRTKSIGDQGRPYALQSLSILSVPPFRFVFRLLFVARCCSGR